MTRSFPVPDPVAAAADALHLAPERYRDLLHSLPECVWISAPDGRLLECNRHWYAYTGASEEDALSGRAWPEVIHAEDLPGILTAWADHLASQEPWTFDFRLRHHASGEWRWHHAYYLPVRDARDELFAWFGIAFDTEETHRTMREHALYSAVVRSSDDAIVTKSLEGIVTSWNAAAERVFGYSAEEMVGSPIAKLLPPDRPREIEGILERVRRGESIAHFETQRRRKDGRIIDISVTVSPVRDSLGRVIGASSIKRDIT